ncbi:C-type lectin domain family 4 member M-like, partial [Saccostrea cucullata]|uniref:C-type lectin domain family 4 member M-like n=1 Tax=Saccostrea cuccullata TaxID=36930 RepID=UPI002ED4C8F0
QNQVLKEELSGLQEQIGNLTEWEKILRLEVSSLREKNANLSNKEQLLQKQMNSQQEKLQNCKGCPDVWVPLENNCYLFSNATATFSEAQRVCARDSAYILEDLSPEEKSFTKSRASTTMWIGATDKLQEGVYVYESTGSIVTDGPWWVGEPGGGRDENCVVAQKMNNWRWDDYPCHFKFHYVCKKTITSTRKLNKTLD